MRKTMPFLMTTILVFITGCRVIIPPEPAAPPTAPTVSDADVTEFPNRVVVEDDNFKLIGRDGKLISIEKKRESADIRDFAAFGICTYRKRIQPLMKDYEKLSEIDIEILKFVLDTQIAALMCFRNVEEQAMLKEEKLITGLWGYSAKKAESPFDRQMQVVIVDSSKEFCTNEDPLYTLLNEWGNLFSNIGREVIEREMDYISKNKYEGIDGFQWRRIWVYFDPTFISYACIKACGADTDLFEEQALRPYKNIGKNAKEISEQWRLLDRVFAHYVRDIQAIFVDTDNYIANVPWSTEKTRIQNFCLEHKKRAGTAIIKVCYLNIDFPFTAFCKKAYIDIQNCKGYFNDDEDEMINVISAFSERASGADMLKKLSSTHAAWIYIQFLELAKSEFGDRWDAVKTAYKLHETDVFNQIFGNINKWDSQHQ